MTITPTFTDTAKAVRDWLRDHADDLGVDSDRIGLGATTGDDSQIVVTRVAGGDDSSDAPLDQAVVQLDVWHATSYNTASNVALRLRTILHALETGTISTTTFGYGAHVESVVFLPDPVTTASRFALTVMVTARAE